jgi:hypothetical protein
MARAEGQPSGGDRESHERAGQGADGHQLQQTQQMGELKRKQNRRAKETTNRTHPPGGRSMPAPEVSATPRSLMAYYEVSSSPRLNKFEFLVSKEVG